MQSNSVAFDFAKMEAAELNIGNRGALVYSVLHDVWCTISWQGPIHRSAFYYLLAINLAYYDLLGLEALVIFLLVNVYFVNSGQGVTKPTTTVMSDAYHICVSLSAALDFIVNSEHLGQFTRWLWLLLVVGLVCRVLGVSTAEWLYSVRIPCIALFAAVTAYYRYFGLGKKSPGGGSTQVDVAEEVAPPTLTPGEDPKPELITQPLLNLYKRPGWTMKNTVEKCTFEDLSVEFCDKKAIRITCECNCTIDTFYRLISDIGSMYKYDAMLKNHEVLKLYSNGVSVLYCAYKVPASMIAARDFSTLNASRELTPEEVRDYGFAPAGETARVIVISSLNDTSKPPQKSFTRGILHVYGYIAVQRTGESKTTIMCVGCVDPSGRIPGWLVDAGNVDTCKKIAKIRSLCEKEQQAGSA